MADRVAVKVDGHRLELSNLDKVLYPAAGFTKGEVIDYYARIAPILLPHVTRRPLTRIRFPNGVEGPGFFEKNMPAGKPAWVPTHTVGDVRYVVVDEPATLIWLANLAALELHVPQWTTASPNPDRLVIDLDPGPPAGLPECCEVALMLRDLLADDGLVALAKTSGKKGMQLMCALPADRSADEISAYARQLADRLAREHPDRIVARMARQLRPGKIFIDWSQNNAAKTTVAPYSLRAQPSPTVSAPVTWDEVAAGEVRPMGPGEVRDRVADDGDLFAPLLSVG